MNGHALSPVLLAISFWSASLATRAQAEPWLSTRFAQNCAGCHAPGRKNLKPRDRRCSLSCQGCHVNPNGGGLRSFYGKWNEDRWLRSYRSDLLKHASSFGPTFKQHYGKDVRKRKLRKRKKARKKKPGVDGFPLVEIDNVMMPEYLYDRRDGLEFIISKNRKEFEYQIPQSDPYRQMEYSKVDAGGDLRWQVSQYSIDGEDTQWKNFFMTGDFAVRWRPLYRNLHLVYEARFLGSPAPGVKKEQTFSAASTRSLYAMVDYLPYNVFIMGGYYRPLFGNFVPDHYALGQEMTSFAMAGTSKNYSLLYNAVSIGTAPNVPYANIHVINKQAGKDEDNTQGFATNLGLRFVTLGASVNYSYWRTTDSQEDATTEVEMHSLNAAAMYWKTVASLELVSLLRDQSDQDLRQGGFWALDTYTRVWRENYFTLMFTSANTTSQITPGSATQMKSGVRSFVIPGLDLMLLYEMRNEKFNDPDQANRKLSGISAQAHVYF